MTSRERILAAVNHQEPDRVPIDCGAMRSTCIQAIAYNSLKAHLGINNGHTRVYDVIQQLAEPENWYLDRFHVDAINAGRIKDGDLVMLTTNGAGFSWGATLVQH